MNCRVFGFRQVESSHVATMETTFDSRAGRLGDPSICAQLYYCGGSTEEHMDRIMKRGFTKEGEQRNAICLLSPIERGRGAKRVPRGIS